MIADLNKVMPSKIPIKFLDEDEPSLAGFDPEVIVEEGTNSENGDAELSLIENGDGVVAPIVETIDLDETPSLDEFDPAKEIAAAAAAAAAAEVATTTIVTAAAPAVVPPAIVTSAAVSATPKTDAPELEEVAVSGDEASAIEARHVAARLERMETELATADEERQELAERLTRVQADFDNYRKRTEREKVRTYQGLVGDVARDLLPVLDNLRRALEAESSVQANESEEFRHFLNGVDMIYRQLEENMKKLGLRPVETVGLRFDPHVHEAVAAEFSDRHEPETVIEEMVRGYYIGESLLRPAMVKVSSR